MGNLQRQIIEGKSDEPNTLENLSAQVKNKTISFVLDKLGHSVGCGEGAMYLMLPGCPTDISLPFGKACYP